MARLSIHLLGPFQVTLHRAPVTDFPSDKVRALLAYLSAEADRPHRRESLAGLLWPDYPEERARGSLRTALASLRMLIGDRQAMPPALHVTRQTVQFNRDSDAWTDVTTFAQLVGPALPAAAGDQPMQRLEEAIGLFRGSFLEGFSLPDSPPFEEWALLTREQLQRQALEALHHLTTHHERQGEIARALEYARRSVELDPFRGATQRQLMRLLALSGQRESALAQYGSYRQLLHAELGVEPSPATQGLHDLLANRQWPPGAPDAASLERELRKTGPSPYRGLAAFQQEDAQFFFGRAAFVQRLVGAVAQDPAVTVVVGPSGCGKSSTIFAGLLPRLVAADEEQWLIVALRPGDRPNHSLAAALMSALEPGPGGEAGPTTAQHEAHGRQGADSTLPRLGEQLDREIPGATRLLLVVDQFEELYTLCPDPEARRHFLDQLLAPSRRGSPAPALRVSLLLALRADFMAQVLTHRPFADALQDATLILGPMDREELRAAIAKPAEVQGAAFEAGLVERMLDDVGEAPGNLPMLEFALTLLWEHQDRGWLTHAAYEAIGQVEGALARFADEVYSGMDPGEETRVRQIFLQLVQPGEGTEDTRRLATRAEVGEGNWGLVQHLADHRLVVTGLDAAGREVVELAHEALIEAWGQLRAWLEEDRAFRTWQEGLRTAIRSWVASCRDEGALLRGAPLAAAEGWLSERDGDLSDAERTFIRASARHRDQREAEREALRRRELEAARRLTEAESRRAQVLQRGAMVLAGILLVVLMLAAAAILAREEATRNERLATARELAAAALNNLDVDPERSALLALQAVEETYAPDKVALPEAVNALHQAVGALRLQLAVASEESLMRFVAFSPDGTRLVTWGLTDWDALPGRTRVWDANSGELTLTLPGIRAAQSWPDGQRLATVLLGESGATHTLWDSRSGEALASAGFSPAAVPTDGDYDPEWRRTATGLLDGRVQVHDLATGQALITLGVEGSPPGWAFVFSPDGERLAAGREDGSVIVWDLDSGDELLSLRGHSGSVSDIVFSRDGRILVTGGGDGKATAWDAESGQALVTLTGHANEILGIAISPDGALLATASWDRTIKVWDLRASIATGNGQELMTLAGHTEAVDDADFGPDGTQLASVDWDGSLRVWDLTPQGGAEGPVFVNGDPPGPAFAASLDLSVDGNRLATANSDDGPRVWDVASGGLISTLSGHGDRVEIIEFSPVGNHVATASHDDSITIWDATGGERLATIADFECGKLEVASCDIAFSPDGVYLAAGDEDGTVGVLEMTPLPGNGSEPAALFTIPAHLDSVFEITYSPDGARLATASWDETAKVWDARTGENLLILAGHGAPVYGAAFGPDGTRLATASQDGTARIWDAGTGEHLITLAGHSSSVYKVRFSPDGSQIATASYDGTAKVWDAANGQEQLTLRGHKSGVSDVRFSPDGSRLYTASVDGTTRVYLLDIRELMALARSRLTRSLTEEECRKYLHEDKCPQLP